MLRYYILLVSRNVNVQHFFQPIGLKILFFFGHLTHFLKIKKYIIKQNNNCMSLKSNLQYALPATFNHYCTTHIKLLWRILWGNLPSDCVLWNTTQSQKSCNLDSFIRCHAHYDSSFPPTRWWTFNVQGRWYDHEASSYATKPCIALLQPSGTWQGFPNDFSEVCFH